MTDKEKYGTLTDAELDDFDQRAREQFRETLRVTRALRDSRRPETEPTPGSEEAKEAVRDAIRQGGEWSEWKYVPEKTEKPPE